MPQADRECLAPTHRQPRDRAVLAVCQHGIVRFDKRKRRFTSRRPGPTPLFVKILT